MSRTRDFVSNRWLIGVLVAIVMSSTGYVIRGYEKVSDAQATSVSTALKKLGEHDVEIATIGNTLKLNQEEILRRLEAIDARTERLERHMFRLRTGTQNP